VPRPAAGQRCHALFLGPTTVRAHVRLYQELSSRLGKIRARPDTHYWPHLWGPVRRAGRPRLTGNGLRDPWQAGRGPRLEASGRHGREPHSVLEGGRPGSGQSIGEEGVRHHRTKVPTVADPRRYSD